MKKAILFSLAFVATVFFAQAQDKKTTDKSDKKETKTKRSNDNDWGNWGNNSHGDWGGERVRGEGPSVSENRETGSFKGMSSGISADIYLRQGSSNKVKIEGQKNILDLLVTEVVEGKLKIGFKKGYSINYKEPLKIYLEAPTFEYLGMSGSGNVIAQNELSGSKLDIKISGSGDFDLDNLQYSDLSVGISGSGDMKLGGKADNINFGISGSGDLDASQLKAVKATCRISGSGDIALNVTKELDASISGSGDINYKGNPPTVKTRVSGSGDIESR